MRMDNAQRGDVGEEIIYILLKHLGFSISSPVKNSDDRGIDFSIEIEKYDIKIQVKTTNIHTIQDNNIVYDFRVSNNNKLVGYNLEDNLRVGILLLVCIDRELQDNFINLTREELIARCKLYWYKPLENTDNTSTITIHIPLENQITNENLNTHIQQWII